MNDIYIRKERKEEKKKKREKYSRFLLKSSCIRSFTLKDTSKKFDSQNARRDEKYMTLSVTKMAVSL